MTPIYSDALPIQLWPADCDTWNESTPEGVHHKKFCQPIQCDDLIRIEFTDILSDDTNFELVTDFHALDTFTNVNDDETSFGPQQNWVITANPSITQSGSNQISKYLRSNSYAFIPGQKYRVSVSVTGAVAAQRPSLTVFSSDMSIQGLQGIGNLSAGQTRTITLTFIADEDTAYIGIQSFFGNVGLPTGAVITVNSRTVEKSIPDAYMMMIQGEEEEDIQALNFTSTVITGTENAIAYYYLSFRFSDYSICDQEVQLKIYKSTGTPDILVLRSDGLDVRTVHPETVLITYSNHRNYAGLYYSSVSPDQEFSIRIPAIFQKQRFPQTQETMQLSSNRIINLNSQIRVQRLLSTGKMPAYMHLKMALVLAHQLISINSEYWVNEEGYERIEATDPRDPFERYTAWLTKKEYIVRNIL